MARTLHKMIEVVREHAQLFKGQFTNATCKDGIFWPAAHQTCPEDIQIEMLSSILPPFSVRSLSRSDWLLVRAHPETIDFSWVESVELSWFAEPVCKDLSNDWVLPRCRLLKTMYTRPFGPDRFKWVVQEKRDIDSLGSCTTTTADVLQQKEERPGYVEYGIVPMELIEIKEDCYDYPLYDEEVNDIVITFSHTLTSFRVEGRNTSSHDNPQKYLHIGRGWVEMPVLTKLHLYLGESNYRVVLDQKLMSHYPNLISIETEDKTRDYSFQDKVPCLPAFLLRLRILYLNGWSALTFNLETISTTTDLANITEADSLDFKTEEVFEIKILFRDGNEDEDEEFYRVPRALDFDRGVAWVDTNILANSSVQRMWVA
ncbi:hypothetical protein BG015_009865 [Linnemannia schmuckeri]|uniref:Uncharacterized protein n=1 Tax=Linnemannia schmuckeri TaxID=64567 RepID=A0A9P5RVB6_9FUNG|nr:hypothetical protein BG015_009865 [Linnemannia schmuckeri]